MQHPSEPAAGWHWLTTMQRKEMLRAQLVASHRNQLRVRNSHARLHRVHGGLAAVTVSCLCVLWRVRGGCGHAGSPRRAAVAKHRRWTTPQCTARAVRRCLCPNRHPRRGPPGPVRPNHRPRSFSGAPPAVAQRGLPWRTAGQAQPTAGLPTRGRGALRRRTARYCAVGAARGVGGAVRPCVRRVGGTRGHGGSSGAAAAAGQRGAARDGRGGECLAGPAAAAAAARAVAGTAGEGGGAAGITAARAVHAAPL
jgi:hypothetical protein